MWNETNVAELRKYTAEGLSASQIATRLGGFSRNAVIGKWHRLGLSRSQSKADMTKAAAARKARKARS